ncbi:tyrosine-protein phosphatase [Granulicella cerasi]|uniref:protein-tyrosine-phosphatase n=1 Tax=Granulicella cerasi TaxID=741063 RepID=A0ABW1Z651_9BACT|nr:CpsB/CapC family capsule biosynthesis tyrosine phosphatase [Granulicella cerasi]
MFDIHNHLLHALDDGSPNLETSVEMARMAVANGTTHMVCTPHASSAFSFQPELIASRMAELRAALQTEGIALQLGQGCDFHIAYDNVQDALAHPRKYTINNSEYLLIELPDNLIPPSFERTLYDLRVAGITPILTHPERNPAIQENPARLKTWVEGGLLVQVTANSVTGDMGKKAATLSHEWLERRWVHFLASDAHDLVRRPPNLKKARAWVDHHVSERYAALLTVDNPQAVFETRPLPEQMPMLGLDDDYDVDDMVDDYVEGPRPWWKRFLGIGVD